MVRIDWTKRAQADLKAIADYISKDSKRFAQLEILKIRNRVKPLKQFMLMGQIVPERNTKEIRELVQGNYRIIYKIVSKEQIDILTIHHTARKFSTHKIK